MSRKHEINKMIIEEIDKSGAEPSIKELVKEILYYEIGNIGETRFSDDYERMIFKSIRQRDTKNENKIN